MNKYYQDYARCFQHLIYEYPGGVPKTVNFAETPTEYEFKMSKYPNSSGQIFLVDK